MQTTFLHALRALERGEAPRSDIAWLIAIATNVCRSQRRSQARRVQIDDAVDVAALPAGRTADEHDVLAELPRALASMPERQRRALLLREWRGLPTHEVAAVLGTSATATHALLTRARRSLADALLATSRSLVVNAVALLAALRRAAAGWLAGGGKVAATGAVAVAVAAGSVATQVDSAAERPVPTTSAPATPPSNPATGEASVRRPALASRPVPAAPPPRTPPLQRDGHAVAPPRGFEGAPPQRGAAVEPREAGPVAGGPRENEAAASVPAPRSPSPSVEQPASPPPAFAQPDLEPPAVGEVVDGLSSSIESVAELSPTPPLVPLPDVSDLPTDAIAPFLAGDGETLAPG